MDENIKKELKTLIYVCLIEKEIMGSKTNITTIINFLIEYNNKYALYKDKLNEMLNNSLEQWDKALYKLKEKINNGEKLWYKDKNNLNEFKEILEILIKDILTL